MFSSCTACINKSVNSKSCSSKACRTSFSRARSYPSEICLSSFGSHSQRFFAYLSMLHVGNDALNSLSMPHLHIQLRHALSFTSVKFLERYKSYKCAGRNEEKCERSPARGACSFREDGPLNSYSALPTLNH